MPPKTRAPVAPDSESQSEPAPSSTSEKNNDVSPPALSVSLIPQYPQITDKDQEFHALVSLKACTTTESDDETRPPVDLILVLDRSGSMSGTPLELVKKASEFVVDTLGEEDRVGF